MGFSGRERRQPRGRGAPPQAQSELGRGAGPLFPSLPLSVPSPPSWTRKGGNLLLVGVGILPWGAPHEAGRPPPTLLYIRRRGHPIDTQVDSCLSRVRCPPP